MSDHNFEALGKSGISDIGGKIETFNGPIDLDYVELESDEVTAVCPVTGQPDFYKVSISYNPLSGVCAESKSVKLYLQSFRDKGGFCEQMASDIADHFFEALTPKALTVVIVQKPRGGVSITAQASRGGE